MNIVALAVWFVLLAIACWAVPAAATRGVVRTLERDGRVVPNFRGRSVVPGLGVAWLGWCLGVAVLAAFWSVAVGMVGEGTMDALMPATFPVESAPLFLVLGAFALGLLDDAYGSHADKGLRGHLAALRQGRLTTGTLKLFGIAALAMVQSSGLAFEGSANLLAVLGAWLAATVTIAGSANLVNLADLRPGRALKVYGVLAAVATSALALDLLGEYWTLGQVATAKGALAVLLFGPLFAVWGLDLRERGMLGDAGSNAAGALAGYALTLALPAIGIAVAAAVVVALNLLAERFSLTEAVDRNKALTWLDGLGRPKEGLGGTNEGA